MLSFYDVCKLKFMYIVFFIGQIFLYLLSMNQNYSIISIITISFIATMIFCYESIFNNMNKYGQSLKRDIAIIAFFIIFKFFFFITFDFNLTVFISMTIGFIIETIIFFFDLRVLSGYFIFVCAFDVVLYLLYLNLKLGVFVSGTFILITVLTFYVLSKLKLIFTKSQFMEYSNHTYFQQVMMLSSAVIKYIFLIIQIFW